MRVGEKARRELNVEAGSMASKILNGLVSGGAVSGDLCDSIGVAAPDMG